MGERVALVTGASGFVGSHMVDLLRQNGYRVVATDVRPPREGAAAGSDGVKFIASDLTQKETLGKVVEGVDDVFHIASIFDYSTPWETLLQVNVGGTRNLLDVLMDSDVKSIVHWSSVAVYGRPQGELLPVKEDHPKNPEIRYDRSKWEQEKAVNEYIEKHKMPITIIRPAPIYGPRNRYGVANIIFAVAKGWVPGFPTNFRVKMPASHVKDVVGSALHLSRQKSSQGQAYNIVDDARLEIRDMVFFVAQQVDAKIVNFIPMPQKFLSAFLNMGANAAEKAAKKRGTRPVLERDTLTYMQGGNYWFSNEKLKSTGYRLLYPDLRYGFLETIDWYKQEGLI